MRNYPFARGHVRIKNIEPIKPAEKVVEEVKEEIPQATLGFLQASEEDVIPSVDEYTLAITDKVDAEERHIKKKKKKNSNQK